MMDINECSDRKIDLFFGEYERPDYLGRKNKPIYRRRTVMNVKKDCFAYRFGHCAIMTETICRWDSCSFYKTVEQEQRDREKYGYDKHYFPKKEKKQ